MTGALWRVSDRVATVPSWPSYATKLPRRGCERRRSVIGRLRFAIVARRVVMSSLVCTIFKTTAMRPGRRSCFGLKRDRARAAADRAKAADDRTRAASDREEAARDRAEAVRHRIASAGALRFATTDELTGAWTRRLGLEEVSRELERA